MGARGTGGGAATTAGRFLPGQRDLFSVEAAYVLYVYSGRFKTIAPFRLVPGDLTVLLLTLLAGAVAWGLLAGRLRPPPARLPVLLVLLLVEFAGASVFWSSLDPINTDKALRFVLFTGSSFFVACMLGQHPASRARLVRLVALLSVALLTYYLYQRFAVGTTSGSIESGALDRVPEAGTNYVENAEHAWLLFTICLTLAVLGMPGQYLGALAGLGAAGVLLTITGGRGPLLLSMLSVPLLAAGVIAARRDTVRRFGRLTVLLLLLAGSGALGYAMLASGSEAEAEQFHTLRRIDAQVSGEATYSMDIRALGRQHAIDQWLRKPLFGWGIGEYTIQEPDLRYPHNLFLEILMETGIVGAALFLGAVAAAVVACARLALDGRAGWADAALMLMFLTDLSQRLTVQGYLADDRMFFGYMGVIIGCGCARAAPARALGGSMAARADAKAAGP